MKKLRGFGDKVVVCDRLSLVYVIYVYVITRVRALALGFRFLLIIDSDS
jgi:hypothetical protein